MAKMSDPFAMLKLTQKDTCTKGNRMDETLDDVVELDVEELAPGLLRPWLGKPSSIGLMGY